MIKLIAPLFVLLMISGVARAYNPSLTDFNTNQFSTNGNRMAVKNGVKETNANFYGETHIWFTNATQTAPRVVFHQTSTNDWTIVFLDQSSNTIGTIGAPAGASKIAITSARQISIVPGVDQINGAIQLGTLLGPLDGDETHSDFVYLQRNGDATVLVPLKDSKKLAFMTSRLGPTGSVSNQYALIRVTQVDTNGQMKMSFNLRANIDEAGGISGYGQEVMSMTTNLTVLTNTVTVIGLFEVGANDTLKVSPTTGQVVSGAGADTSFEVQNGSGIRYFLAGKFGNQIGYGGMSVATNWPPPADPNNFQYPTSATWIGNSNGTIRIVGTSPTGTAWTYTNTFVGGPHYFRTNFIDGQLYTNSTGVSILVSAKAALIATTTSGQSSLHLEMPGNETNNCTVPDGIGVLAPSTNILSGIVTNGGTYQFTNKSTGAGNSATVVGGQITILP